MPNAILTTTTTTPTQTQAGVVAAIEAGMLNAGFSSPIDSYASGGTEFRVYSYQFNGLSKGTAYIRTEVTSGLLIRQHLSDNWDSANNTSATPQSQSGATLTAGNTITYHAINHPELRLVIVLNGSSIANVFGYVRPANKYSWWNESSFLYCFSPSTGANWSNANSPIPNPASSSLVIGAAINLMTTDSPPSSSPQNIVAPFLCGTNAGSGLRTVLGLFSTDVGQCSVSSVSLMQELQSLPSRYLVACASSTGVSVKIA